MGEGNSHNETDETESGYENEEGDTALITRLPARGKSISFERTEVTGKVEELLKGAMTDHVSCEQERRRTMVKVMRTYRNYVSVWFYEHTNIYLFVDDKCPPRISSWVHLYKGKKHDAREMVAGIQESQIYPVLEVREEERAQAIVRAFLHSDEYHGFMVMWRMRSLRSMLQGIITMEVQLRRVRDALRKEKEAHVATKEELAKLKALFEKKDERPEDGREQLIVHSTEVRQAHGPFEAVDASLEDTNLQFSVADNQVDVGYTTAEDTESRKCATKHLC
ncbi:hypothetical protein Cgig2_011866 [Carnegiea gigantea]|uniref:Uncharacterized protein n=1 Tax=Carnegiea gigantea TaxID=171969 RepID=A0A9Q1K8D7_9CARY|nr:hypothetical protein Cgig2_011866 [Carnegiea gigantea]